jgi:hypothetical protein
MFDGQIDVACCLVFRLQNAQKEKSSEFKSGKDGIQSDRVQNSDNNCWMG